VCILQFLEIGCSVLQCAAVCVRVCTCVMCVNDTQSGPKLPETSGQPRSVLQCVLQCVYVCDVCE